MPLIGDDTLLANSPPGFHLVSEAKRVYLQH
jgi:hypothetical protein